MIKVHRQEQLLFNSEVQFFLLFLKVIWNSAVSAIKILQYLQFCCCLFVFKPTISNTNIQHKSGTRTGHRAFPKSNSNINWKAMVKLFQLTSGSENGLWGS